jgi:hypothetical protein
MVRAFRLIVFFAVVTSVFAGGTLDALVNAAEDFSLAIQQQIAAVQSITTPTELAEKTILYAAAKTAYYQALRAGGARIDGYCDRQKTATAGREILPTL